jgi:hypothetical protein
MTVAGKVLNLAPRHPPTDKFNDADPELAVLLLCAATRNFKASAT